MAQKNKTHGGAEIKKAPGANRGNRQGSAAGAKINLHSEYSILSPAVQPPPFSSAVSTLLDQALFRYENAADLARIYAAEAEKHRAILHSLQSLIPTNRRGKGGAA